jgi:hypothetical protein
MAIAHTGELKMSINALCVHYNFCVGDEIEKKSSPLKLLSQFQPISAEMILGWSPSKIVSDISELRPRWPPQPNLA